MAWFTQENMLFAQYIQPGGQFIHCNYRSVYIYTLPSVTIHTQLKSAQFSVLNECLIQQNTTCFCAFCVIINQIYLHTFTTAKLASLFGVSQCRLSALNWRETLIEIGIKL
eukprot:473714_1